MQQSIANEVYVCDSNKIISKDFLVSIIRLYYVYVKQNIKAYY